MKKNLADKIKFIRCTRKFFAVINAESYYPDNKRKSYRERFIDNLSWVLKYGAINNEYNFYGMDIEGSVGEYLDAKTSNRTRERMNGTRDNKKSYNHVILLRDKYVFYNFLKALNMPTPQCFAISIKGEITYLNGIEKESDIFLNREKIFAKILEESEGKGIFCINNNEQLNQIKELWKNERYLLQEAVEQHPDMNKLYDGSINTIRLITAYYNNDAHYLSAVLRCGTKQSGIVDNFAQGGYVIGINEDGTLKKHGLCKSPSGLASEMHPDSNVKFEEFKIPFYKEAVEIACKLHKHFYGVVAIGWDIAITPNGPVFIEGNQHWVMEFHSALDKEFKEKWLNLCSIYKVTK